MTIRVGVAGTGHWARTVHAAGVAASPYSFAGIWGRDEVRATEAADAHGVPVFTDFDTFLGAVDAVSFALPPHVQAPLATRAARAGKHLLLEKPIATNVAAADELVDAAGDVASVVFLTGRFVPAWEEWLHSVHPGRVESGRAEWLVRMSPTGPYAGSLWRKDRGALWDVGPHALSVLLPILGSVVSVAGAHGRGDHVELVLTHEHGGLSTMSLSMSLATDDRRISAEFWGQDGHQVRPDVPRDVAAAYATALSELVATAEAGQTGHRCDVRFGREIVDVLARCEEVLSR